LYILDMHNTKNGCFEQMTVRIKCLKVEVKL